MNKIKRILIKTSYLVFVFSFLFIGQTASFFQDQEIITNNTFETGTLDMGLRSGQTNFVSNAENMGSGDSVARDIYVQNNGSLDFEYHAEYEFVSGDQELCNALVLNTWYNRYWADPPAPGDHSTRTMHLKYSGMLKDFDDFDTNTPIHDPELQIYNSYPYFNNIFYAENEHWHYFKLTLPYGSDHLLNKTCVFNIKFKAEQIGGAGFSDEEIIQSTISTKHLCEQGEELVQVDPIDKVNIGDSLSEDMHDIDGWSAANIPGIYGGGSSDGTYRQLVETTGCNDDGREAKFVLYAGERNANMLTIRALDGMSNLDSFEVYVNDNLLGTYTDQQDSQELWHTFEVPLGNLSGRLEIKLKAIDALWGSCSQFGQVAITWAEISGYYCAPDNVSIPGVPEASCEQDENSVDVGALDEVNVGDLTSENGHSKLGWSTENLPGNYGGKDDGTYRQIISEQYCNDEYRVAGFTLSAGESVANKLELRVLDGISNNDGFDVYVNDEFTAHIPDLTLNHPENWVDYEIGLPNLTGDIKVRFVGIDEFWDSCSQYGQVPVSWVKVSGYECEQPADSTPTPTPAETGNPSPTIKINEVYYNGGKDEEWVELYNAGSESVDLQNWTIEDGNSSDILTTTGLVLNPAQFAVIIGSTNPGVSIAPGARLITLDNPTIGSGLNDSGDRLILKDNHGVEQDFVAWEGYKPGWDIEAGSGESIARTTAGVDTDSPSDWKVLTLPNPGTNPHSHIQVNAILENNNLLISFTNAYGFDLVKYQINYQHKFNNEIIESQILGEQSKDLNQTELNLDPIYLGTCSTQGTVCTPHENVQNIVISLLYKNGTEILGSEDIIVD